MLNALPDAPQRPYRFATSSNKIEDGELVPRKSDGDRRPIDQFLQRRQETNFSCLFGGLCQWETIAPPIQREMRGELLFYDT